VFGPFPGTVALDNTSLVVNGTPIPFHQVGDIGALDLRDVDILLECPEAAGNRSAAMRGLDAGAQTVLISGPYQPPVCQRWT
jgi:glyceraldehyde 3-phosphate dehydrogenase